MNNNNNNNNIQEGVMCYKLSTTLNHSVELSQKHNILILEKNNNKDYYSINSFPPNKHQNDWRLFIPVDKSVHFFDNLILKTSYQIKHKYNSEVEVMPSHIEYEGQELSCIRVNTQNAELLTDIIEIFRNNEVTFMKNKKVKDFSTLLSYEKFTELSEIEKGVYEDNTVSGYYFFEIKNQIDCTTLISGIEKIKYSCNFHSFDVLLAFMFNHNGKNLIGIHSENCDRNRFGDMKKQIEKTFQEQIELV
ncbi:MAG: hypothetical protein KAG96_04705 [Ichthyobacteriaceae bacterium]|nr:hypothetical protein [Ichthyobacteriaceae bacterium]